jgi:hypothetical protein
VERARQAAQSWEELIDGLETTEQQVEALEIMKNTMMAAQYGAECGWLATCCGTRALNTVTWLLGRYFALKIYYSVS